MEKHLAKGGLSARLRDALSIFGLQDRIAEVQIRLSQIEPAIEMLNARLEVELPAMAKQVEGHLDEVRTELGDRLAALAERLQSTQASSSDLYAIAKQLEIHLNEVRTELGGRLAGLAHELRKIEHESTLVTKSVEAVYGLAVTTREVVQDRLPLIAANLVGLSSRLDEVGQGVRVQLGSTQNAGGAALPLYLNLIETSLVGGLADDGRLINGEVVSADPLVRIVGFDWPAAALTMIGKARMRNLRMLTERVLNEGIPGDLIEAGVWRGGACIYMAAILAAYGDKTRRVFVADSFQGLPPPNPEAYPADEGDRHSTFEELRVSADQVRENFRRYGLLSDQIVLLEGWFKDTLSNAPIEKLALLRLDGDMYESTIETLDAIYHKVSPGGFVVIDDYILTSCAQAVDDFRKAHGINAPMVPVDTAAVWWQVS